MKGVYKANNLLFCEAGAGGVTPHPGRWFFTGACHVGASEMLLGAGGGTMVPPGESVLYIPTQTGEGTCACLAAG